MIVLGIIALVSVLTLPSIGNLIRSYSVTQGGTLVETTLTAARNRALAKNRPVQVRFYNYSSLTGPGFQAIQPFDVVISSTSQRPHHL